MRVEVDIPDEIASSIVEDAAYRERHARSTGTSISPTGRAVVILAEAIKKTPVPGRSYIDLYGERVAVHAVGPNWILVQWEGDKEPSLILPKESLRESIAALRHAIQLPWGEEDD